MKTKQVTTSLHAKIDETKDEICQLEAKIARLERKKSNEFDEAIAGQFMLDIIDLQNQKNKLYKVYNELVGELD